MRPAQIRVFDGLRVTTEHLNHLQDSLRSSVQDLREILGLGVVFRGFEVVASGEHEITVKPGLAFDFGRNRLVRDDPLVVEVTIEDGDAQFVCLKYTQIEDGQVEGQSTLIWDSCSVVVRPTLPTVEDNLVTLAIVSRAPDGNLAITSLKADKEEQETSLTDTEPGSPPADGPDISNGATTSEGEGASLPSTNPSANGAVANDGTTIPAMSAPGTNGALHVENGGSTPVAGGEDTPSEVAASIPAVWSIRQGIERLAGTNGTAIDLASQIIGTLRNRLAGTESSSGDLRFNLFQGDVAVDGTVRSLTTHAILAATITPNDSAPVNVLARAEGETTYTGSSTTQYGISTMQTQSGEAHTMAWTSELTERGVAHMLFGGSADGAQPSEAQDVLQHIQLVLRIDSGTMQGFRLICDLIWSGDINDTVIDNLNTMKPMLRWNATLAWKAWCM